MPVKALREGFLALSAVILLGACAFSVPLSATEEPPKPERGGPRAGPTASKELMAEITEKDRIFFDAFFNKCDVETVGNFVTDDFEFYHDKGGLTATSRAQFVESIRNMCARQKTGEDYRARRGARRGEPGGLPSQQLRRR